MAIKVRVLVFSKKGKMVSLGDAICMKLDCKADKIPPAYPCENERLLFLGATIGKEIPAPLRMFCAGLNKTRAQNVALFVDGPESSVTEIKNILTQAGTKVANEVYHSHGGLPFAFAKKISEEERSGIVAWAQKLHAEISAL
jgi:hypothetical protein